MIKFIANTTVAALCLLSSAYSYADSLQFSAPTYTVAEHGVTASITVTRVFSSFWTRFFTVVWIMQLLAVVLQRVLITFQRVVA